MILLDKKDVATILLCKVNTVSHLVSSRQLPYLKIGKEVRFRKDSIEAWIVEREQKF